MGTKRKSNFGGAKSGNGGGPDRNARGVPSRATILSIPWQRDRAQILHRLCKAIERRRAAGLSLRKAIRYPAWFWKGRSYSTEQRRKVRFGRGMLVSRYYFWLRNGKSPDCFGLQYGARLAPVTSETVRAFVRACETAGTRSISQAARLAGFKTNRPSRVLARLPRVFIRRMKEVFKERRQAELEAQAAVKALQREIRRLKAADQRRGRELKKLAGAI